MHSFWHWLEDRRLLLLRLTLLILISTSIGSLALVNRGSGEQTVDQMADQLARGVGESTTGYESKWVDGRLKSTVSAGLWASADAKGRAGQTMRVEPGNDVDEDEWLFLFGGTLVHCQPQLTETHWVFEDCRIDGYLRDFKAKVSRQPGYAIEVEVDTYREQRHLKMRKVAAKYWD